jgi:hypothetical protein
VSITLSCATAAARIYYTLDGSDPTTSSALYQSEIKLTGSATLKAKAVKTGYNDSTVATANFTISRRRR